MWTILALILAGLVALYLIVRYAVRTGTFDEPAKLYSEPLPAPTVPAVKRQQPRKPDGRFDSYEPPIIAPFGLDMPPGSFDPTYPSWGDDQFTSTASEPFGFGDSGSSSSDFSGGGGDFGGGGASDSW